MTLSRLPKHLLSFKASLLVAASRVLRATVITVVSPAIGLVSALRSNDPPLEGEPLVNKGDEALMDAIGGKAVVVEVALEEITSKGMGGKRFPLMRTDSIRNRCKGRPGTGARSVADGQQPAEQFGRLY